MIKKLLKGSIFLLVLFSIFISNIYAFDVPSAPYDDPPDSYTKLQCSFDEADTSTTTDDESAGNYTLTNNGNVQTDTAQYKWTASSLFDGTEDYWSIPDSDDWNFGTGLWTIDFWVRFATDPHVADTHIGAFFSQRVDASHQFIIRVAYDGHFWLEAYDVDLDIQMQIYTTGDFFIAADTWYHAAIVRYGTGANNLAMYLNGVSQALNFDYGMAANEAFPDIAAPLLIGYVITNYYMNGWIDEFRISKGIARDWASATRRIMIISEGIWRNFIWDIKEMLSNINARLICDYSLGLS